MSSNDPLAGITDHDIAQYLASNPGFFEHHAELLALGADEVAAFLTHLAVTRTVAPATQNQAKAALLFLYRAVLGVDLPWLDEVVRAKGARRLPVRTPDNSIVNRFHRRCMPPDIRSFIRS